MFPVLAKAYPSCPPQVVEGMTLRQISALLSPLAPSERDALMAQHPGMHGRS